MRLVPHSFLWQLRRGRRGEERKYQHAEVQRSFQIKFLWYVPMKRQEDVCVRNFNKPRQEEKEGERLVMFSTLRHERSEVECEAKEEECDVCNEPE